MTKILATMSMAVLVGVAASGDASADQRAGVQLSNVNNCPTTASATLSVPYAVGSYASTEAPDAVTACNYIVDASVAGARGTGPAVIHFSSEPQAAYAPTTQSLCSLTHFTGSVEVSTATGWQLYGAQNAITTGQWISGQCHLGIENDAVDLRYSAGLFRVQGRAWSLVNGVITLLPMVARVTES